MKIYHSYITSDCGILRVGASDEGIVEISFVDKVAKEEANDISERGIEQLREYFLKERTTFDLALRPIGTEFQITVWQALLNIPFGESRSYLDLAKEVGSAKHTRAVGLANGKNPIAIVIPCHRVIGSDGSLTGYAGGMDKKKWLLRHEGVLRQMEMF